MKTPETYNVMSLLSLAIRGEDKLLGDIISGLDDASLAQVTFFTLQQLASMAVESLGQDEAAERVSRIAAGIEAAHLAGGA